MSSRKATAVTKRDEAPLPHIKTLTEAKGKQFPAGKMLISSPLELKSVVAIIPRGKVLTLGTLRQHLATKHRADYTCPLTTGIFLRVLAEAAAEEGKADEVPVWRVVRDDGRLLDKLPGGVEAQAAKLRAEGVAVGTRGKALEDVAQVSWAPEV